MDSGFISYRELAKVGYKTFPGQMFSAAVRCFPGLEPLCSPARPGTESCSIFMAEPLLN